MFRLFRNIKQLLGFGILIGLFSAGVYFMHGEVAEAKKTLQWPTTEGLMQVSQVNSSQERDSDGYTRTMYFVKLKYSYEVNGTKYTADKYEFSSSKSTSRNEYAEIAKQFPVGSTTTVYYNPEDFGDAVLKPGVPFILNLVTWIFTIVTAIMWLVVFNKVIKLAFGLTIAGAFVAERGARVIGSDNKKSTTDETTKQTAEARKSAQYADDAFDMR